jgi:hypothetical protein
MKYKNPKVLSFLPLQEYAPNEPELAGVGLYVWVDPPRSALLEFDQLNRDYGKELDKLAAKMSGQAVKKASPAERILIWMRAREKHLRQDGHFKSATENYRRSLYAWYARLWSQSPDAETHWSVEELEKTNEANPHLYEWLCHSSWALIEQHRADVKKGYRGPSEKLPAPAAPATPS